MVRDNTKEQFMKKLSNYILKIIILLIFGISLSISQKVKAEETVTEEITTVAEEETTIENPTVEEPTSAESEKYVVSKLSPSTSKVVVLDPGHCNIHGGAIGSGLKEEKVVLDIAKACKKELDKYGNINVYMTRTTNDCCKSFKLGDCLEARNNFAKRLSADFLISMHINADASPYMTGALVLPAYKSGYNDAVRVKTQKMGKAILSNLHSLGLKNTGFWLRKSDDIWYKNGARADYYSIVRNGVLKKIPSIIIEHGYITNPSDCEKYFSTKAKRNEVGIADADAIISYYDLKQNTIAGKFVKRKNATYYVTPEGLKVKGWVKHNGNWYYFSQNNGKMKKGFLNIDKNTFYLKKSTGAMAVGWFNAKGSKYMAKGNGVIVKNTTYSDGINTYLFGKTGKKYIKGMHKIKGKYYYVSRKTKTIIRNKTIKIHGKKYYFSKNGVRKKY